MSSQMRELLEVLELARDGAAGAAQALMLADGSVMLEFPAHNGSVRVHPDGRVDQIWRDGDGLHAQFGDRPVAKEQSNDVAT